MFIAAIKFIISLYQRIIFNIALGGKHLIHLNTIFNNGLYQRIIINVALGGQILDTSFIIYIYIDIKKKKL